MMNEPLDPEFPYRNYTDYIRDLSAVDEGYTALYELFSLQSSGRREPGTDEYVAEVNGDRDGSVAILDSVDGKLNLRQYMVNKVNAAEDLNSCIQDVEQDLSDSHTRVIFISYYRSPLYAGYSGLDLNVLDAIGYKYRIHPEVYLWHFGSDFGIFNTHDPFAKPPLPSALSSRRYFHIWNHHSIISTCLHTAAGARKTNTGGSTLAISKKAFMNEAGALTLLLVVIFARDYRFADQEPLLTSRINFLDSNSYPEAAVAFVMDFRIISAVFATN